jgi:hypothetical protein
MKISEHAPYYNYINYKYYSFNTFRPNLAIVKCLSKLSWTCISLILLKFVLDNNFLAVFGFESESNKNFISLCF